ncbi:hypothetical protein BDV96DRAFT_661095 [Lophiotrema nucula]|uniref:Glucose-methanol-choline oxidoreductase N-terminal domain-containing protein n=1 Tax=Lophiotrema nucula TaxID=690887 RepID=A0A6A5Z8J4_9PLEO|nr:hypothetical protein BDV96DRAFT_661095 [Lophiotrema nucula]
MSRKNRHVAVNGCRTCDIFSHVYEPTHPQNAPNEFDFIVIGGCTAAGRLAENADMKILVIEAGPHNTDEIDMISTPGRAFELKGSQYDWGYKASMIDRPEYTRVEKPDTRGRCLAEAALATTTRGCVVSATYHDDDDLYPDVKDVGRDGPVHVAHPELLPETRPFRDAFKQSWASIGLQFGNDVYNGSQSGLSNCISSIYKGVRSDASVFLEGRDNVTVMPLTYSKLLDFDGTKAVGVTVTHDGQDYTFKARHEVIVSLGVYESPKLLLLSGIGPEDQLKQHGIDVRVDSQHHGEDLLDHPILAHCFRLKDGFDLNSHILRPGPQKSAAIEAYQRNKEGPLSSRSLDLVTFPRCDEKSKTLKDYRQYLAEHNSIDPFSPAGQPRFEIDFVLRSKDALEQPEINRRFFSDPLDLVALREGIRTTPWAMPRNSDEAMKTMFLERSQTGFHPCGSCRLSKDISQGVVDTNLQVHGTDSLRVIDASNFPTIPDCRIQNDVYMVAEKGADMIKAAYQHLYRKPSDGGSIVTSALGRILD